MSGNKILLAITALAFILLSPYSVLAVTNDEAARELYEQLVINEQDTAVTHIENIDERAEVVGKLTGIDDPDNVYDGAMSIYKAPSFAVRYNDSGKMQVTLNNNFKKAESEIVLDEMTEEIDKTLPDNATKEQKLNAIINFIKKTFRYDFARYLKKDMVGMQNYIQAYHGDRRIVCEEYAVVTLLLCDRYDIDCRIVEGYNHLFNIIRLDSDSEYVAYDLTKASFFMPAKVGYIDQITGTYTVREGASMYEKTIARVINTAPYRISLTYIDILAVLLIFGPVATAIIRPRLRQRKRRKKMAFAQNSAKAHVNR